MISDKLREQWNPFTNDTGMRHCDNCDKEFHENELHRIYGSKHLDEICDDCLEYWKSEADEYQVKENTHLFTSKELHETVRYFIDEEPLDGRPKALKEFFESVINPKNL